MRVRVRVKVRVMMTIRADFTVRVKVCRVWVRRVGQGCGYQCESEGEW